MLKIIISGFIGGLSLFIYVYIGIRVSIDSIIEGLNAIIIMQSIMLGIYSASLSIIASLHDTELVKKLLRNESSSKKEIMNLNNSAFISNVTSLLFLISFLIFHEYILTMAIVVYIYMFLVPFLLSLSLMYIFRFYYLMNLTLFNQSNHSKE